MTPSKPSGRAATPGLNATPGLIALFCILWSSAFAVGKVALVDCPPLLLLGLRFLLAAIILVVACVVLKRWGSLPPRDWGALILAGLLNNGLYLGLSFTGMTQVSSGFTAVIISANPLVTALMAGPVLGERLNGRKALGLVLGFLGVVIVLRSRLSGGHEALAGTLFVLGGLLALTAGTLVYKRLPTSADLWQGTGIQLLAGSLALLPVAFLTEDVSALHLTPSFLWSFAYMVLGVSIGGYGLWYFILGRSSATEATALHFMMPPLGLMFGWLILGEGVPPLDFLGVLPIAAGIWLVTR